MIHLVGPGAAGKSTVGAALASRLQLSFLDLDMRFRERAGDISQYIDRHGYQAYARENVETYRSCIVDADCRGVVALSSGFMTYPERIHPVYHTLRTEIASSISTFVLLPSLDPEACVAETVRRQVTRPFRRSREREEAVIRERYAIYMALPAPKVETMRPVDEVGDEIASGLPKPAQPQCSTRSRPADEGERGNEQTERDRQAHGAEDTRAASQDHTAAAPSPIPNQHASDKYVAALLPAAR